MMKKIYNHFNLILYYILLLLGTVMASWLIWSRFIRTRTIRDIPDYLLTEYRFWVLLYICVIYILVIKNLLKPSKTSNPIFKEIINVIYKPLITLDHAIKYNKYVKPHYYKIMFNFLTIVDLKNIPSCLRDSDLEIIIFLLQIFPRLILATILFFDTFYFHKLELFYKFVLIGVLPFIFRYMKYSCKDILEHWILTLEDKYDIVEIYEKGYKFDKSREGNTEAILHGEKVSIREFIEIQQDTFLEYIADDIDYQYESFPFCKKHVFDKYKKTNTHITAEELTVLKTLYYELMPKIIIMKLFLSRLEATEDKPIINRSKIIIFSTYLICWSFILIISYGHYPIELQGAKHLLINIMLYLCNEDNPFAELYWGSRSKNLITKETLQNILHNIITKMINLIK